MQLASVRRQLATAGAVLLVLFAYAFFASGGRLRSLAGDEGGSYYTLLSKGFLKGQLSLDVAPDPRLLALANPYEIKQRDNVVSLWDASLYQGKYYLYFSALPALIAYIPMRLLFHWYPADSVVALAFTSLSFLVWVATFLLILGDQPSTVPRWLWVLTLGLGSGLPSAIAAPNLYEVPISCGMLWAAVWANLGFRLYTSKDWRWAAPLGLAFGLAIASRPNLAVLAIPTLGLLASTGRRNFLRAHAACAAPVALIVCALGAYNYARFGAVNEYGLTYQLTFIPMAGQKVCSLCSVNDVTRMVGNVNHYLFWTPRVTNVFPYLQLLPSQMDVATAFPMAFEQIGGLLPLSPFTGIALVFGAAMLMGTKITWSSWEKYGLLLMLSAFAVMAGLSTCWWVVERYTMDFTGMALCGAAICVEAGSRRLVALVAQLRRIQMLVWLLLCYSLVGGVLLGFRGSGDRFERTNPQFLESVRAMMR